jgi:hypothetical protein
MGLEVMRALLPWGEGTEVGRRGFFGPALRACLVE